MCFCCSKHGRFDAGVGGLRDVARLVLQHRVGPELRGAAAEGTELHSLHRELPASARFVKVSLLHRHCWHALPNMPVTPCHFYFFYFSEVGWSRQVQREHGETLLIRLDEFRFCEDYQRSLKCELLKETRHQQGCL